MSLSFRQVTYETYIFKGNNIDYVLLDKEWINDFCNLPHFNWWDSFTVEPKGYFG